jgi:hypothetical protein
MRYVLICISGYGQVISVREYTDPLHAANLIADDSIGGRNPQ